MSKPQKLDRKSARTLFAILRMTKSDNPNEALGSAREFQRRISTLNIDYMSMRAHLDNAEGTESISLMFNVAILLKPGKTAKDIARDALVVIQGMTDDEILRASGVDT